MADILLKHPLVRNIAFASKEGTGLVWNGVIVKDDLFDSIERQYPSQLTSATDRSISRSISAHLFRSWYSRYLDR